MTDNPVYYGHRFPDDLEVLEAGAVPMDRVSPYPPELFTEVTRFTTQHCLLTRAVWPMRVYGPATDLLPRTLGWLDNGVPLDFIDRVDSRLAAFEAPDPGECWMAH